MGTFLKRSNTAKLHYSEDELLQLFTEAENTSEDKGVSLSADKIKKVLIKLTTKLNSLNASQFSALQNNPQKMATFLSGLFENVSSSKIKQIISSKQQTTKNKSGAESFQKGGVWYDGVWKDGTWEDGTWKDGIWKGGVWEDGTWRRGIWERGTWKAGVWQRGTWKNGRWMRGVWEDGVWRNGEWENGTWFHGTWKRGDWDDGTWEDGVWTDGTWRKGKWKGGVWKIGWIYDPNKKGNFKEGWEWHGKYVRSPINPKEYFKVKK